MSITLPLLTRRQIVREYRPDGTVTEASAVRRLRMKGALSAGLSVEARGEAGRLGGRLHLYSALNRDAARAVRQHQDALAAKIGAAAARLERSAEARRLAQALGSIGGTITASDLARALSQPALLKDAQTLQRRQQEQRRRLGVQGASTVLSGHITAISDAGATLTLQGLPNPVSVPRGLLSEAGLDAVGEAVSAIWEILPGGRTLMTVEPAVDLPEVNQAGEALLDLYGTPWGRVLTTADDEALRVTGTPTVRIPTGIPDVE